MSVISATAVGGPMAWLLGVTTVWSMLVFVGWAIYALHPTNRAAFERASYLPLDDGDAS